MGPNNAINATCEDAHALWLGLGSEKCAVSVEGKLISIGERNLYARIKGRGPVVVLNSGGGQSGTKHWEPIESALHELATTLTYDRAGLGRSDPPPEPPTALDMAKDLHGLLNALNADRPIVLVGWSLSALLVQLYACEFPMEVAGVILLDPTPDRFFKGFNERPPAVRDRIRSMTLEKSRTMGGEGSFLLEMQKVPESSEQVRLAVEDQKRFPNIPVTVLSACKRTEATPAVSAGGDFLASEHQRIVDRFSLGRLVRAEKSAHRSMTSDEPELIVEAIRSVIGGSHRKHA